MTIYLKPNEPNVQKKEVPGLKDTGVWILTFDRPHALNRLIKTLGEQGLKSNIFSNHPKLELLNENKPYVGEVVVNSLNSTHSNSWCARSWNSIMLRSWHLYKRLILIQDDTMVSNNFVNWFAANLNHYDFMWGPGGDQWHSLTFDVFQKVGYWDERYIGCYCGDADYVKRVWHNWDHSRLSIEEKHNWGMFHNVSGICENVLTEMNVKMIDPNYQNQHWQLGGTHKPQPDAGVHTNPTIARSQRHFFDKWGEYLDSGKSIADTYNRVQREIDWYPWFTKIHNVNIEESPMEPNLSDWAKECALNMRTQDANKFLQAR